jgi:hypothetical protein
MVHDWGVSLLRLSLFSGERVQLSDEDWKVVTGVSGVSAHWTERTD